MTGRFERIFPPKGRVLLDGGKNNKFSPTVIADNESPDCANVVFENGTVATREGYTKLNTASVGTFVCDGLYTRHTNADAESMCAWFGGTMFVLSGTSLITIGSAQSVWTAGVRVGAAQYEGHIFFGNGGNTPYKYNGTDFTRHGVIAPTVTASVATASTGTVLTGDYNYKFTFVNSQLVEGDVSPATATFTASSENATITSIPTGSQSHGVAQRRIYRTVAGGTTFKRVATISDNSTTTFDDGVSDNSLGVNAPTDQGEPPNYAFAIYHNDRVICNDPANPNFWWYSELNEPYTFKTTNFERVGDNSTDIVTGFGTIENHLLVFGESTVTIVYMPSTDPLEWERVVTKSPYGTKSPFGVFEFNGRQMFPAVQADKFIGFSAMAGASIEPTVTLLTTSASGSELQSDRIEPDMFNIVEAQIDNISSIVYKNKAWIAVTRDSGNTTNNFIYHFDFSLSNLSKDQRASWVPFTGIKAAQFTIFGGDLYFGESTATGFVHKLEDGTFNDDGSAIDSFFFTKEFSGFDQDFNFTKDFRRLSLLVDNAGAYFMDVSYMIDSDSGTGTNFQLDLNPGGSLWGTMVWGSDDWGGGRDQEEIFEYLANSRGRRIKFKFSNQNTKDQRFKVHGFNYAYNIKGVR